MARRVYFAFHFEQDIWRVNQIRNTNVVLGSDQAGFFDHSEYDEVKKKDPAEIRRRIRDRLVGTSVTVVLIGAETATRQWVQFEIAESAENKNGLFGVYIHLLQDQAGNTSPRGAAPQVPASVEFPTFVWDPGNWNACVARLRSDIEAAGQRADAQRKSSAYL